MEAGFFSGYFSGDDVHRTTFFVTVREMSEFGNVSKFRNMFPNSYRIKVYRYSGKPGDQFYWCFTPLSTIYQL